MNKNSMTAQQKVASMPFSGGSRACPGIHLAYTEPRLGAALFFRECRGARLRECMHDEMMEMEIGFLISPKGHCCCVILQQNKTISYKLHPTTPLNYPTHFLG